MTPDLMKFIKSDPYQEESRLNRSLTLLAYNLPERVVKNLLTTTSIKQVISICSCYGLDNKEIRRILQL